MLWHWYGFIDIEFLNDVIYSFLSQFSSSIDNLSRFFHAVLGPWVTLLPKTFKSVSNLLCTWCRSFQKRTVRTNFDIYVFIKYMYKYIVLILFNMLINYNNIYNTMGVIRRAGTDYLSEHLCFHYVFLWCSCCSIFICASFVLCHFCFGLCFFPSLLDLRRLLIFKLFFR